MRSFGIAVAAGMCLALAGVAYAAEEPAAQAAARAAPAVQVKAGDTVYVCGCGAACKCATIQAEPGKCGCGNDLQKAAVKKVKGDKITVAVAGAKKTQVFKAPYRCACGGACKCTTAALGPGTCGCGRELAKSE